MRKWLLALGLVLFLVGMIFTSSAVQAEEIIDEKEEFIKTEANSYQISINLIQGDKVRLTIAQGIDWVKLLEPQYEGLPFPHKFVYVNITDPNGEDSMFEVTYIKYQDDFFLYNISVVASRGGFEAENSSRKIVGYVRVTGLYTAAVTGAFPALDSPPSALTFFNVYEEVTTDYPYSHLLYPGIAILGVSVVLSTLGAKTSKQQVRRKRRGRVRALKRQTSSATLHCLLVLCFTTFK